MTTHELAQLLLAKDCLDISLSTEQFLDLNDDKGMYYLQFTVVDNYEAAEEYQRLQEDEQQRLNTMALEDEWYHNYISEEQQYEGPKCHYCNNEAVGNDIVNGVPTPVCPDHHNEYADR